MSAKCMLFYCLFENIFNIVAGNCFLIILKINISPDGKQTFNAAFGKKRMKFGFKFYNWFK